MKIDRIWAVYFSPTGGTRKVVMSLAGTIGEQLQKEVQELDFTKLENREKTYSFTEKDLVVIGIPVYAGRVPNKILPDLEKCMEGNGAKAVAVSVYGNRSFDDALMELKLLLQEKGFEVIGAAAVVSRHAFSDTLAAGRPDDKDMVEINTFAKSVAAVLKNESEPGTAGLELPSGVLPMELIPGNNPVGPYYTPLQEDGTPAKFLKAKPVTDAEKCSKCGICATVCPMGSIDITDCTVVTGVCIKCQACVKKCPEHAKYFDDEQFLSHVKMLEQKFARRAENYFFTRRAI